MRLYFGTFSLMPSFSLRTICLGTLSILITLPAMAFGIGLQPTTVELAVAPGERTRQVINIANVHTERTISLTLGLADWSLDAAGQIRLSPPGEGTVSAAPWARFSPAFLTLEPGESEQVIVDMSVPSRLKRSGDYRFALLASTILPEDRNGQSGVWKKYQIASLFYLTTGRANSKPQIASSELVTDADGQSALQLNFANTGNAHARLEGIIEIDQGDRTETVKIANLVILHDAERNYVAWLPDGTDPKAKLEVKLQNIFAPQANSGREILPPYKVPSDVRKAAITGEPDTESLP